MQIVKGMRDGLSKYCNLDTPIDICVSPATKGMAFFCFATDSQGSAIDDFWIAEKHSGSAVTAIDYFEGNRVKRYSIAVSQLPSTVYRMSFILSCENNIRDGAYPVLAVRQNNTTVLTLEPNTCAVGHNKAIVLFELYRKGEWRFASVLRGYKNGLADFLADISFSNISRFVSNGASGSSNSGKTIYSEWAGKSIIDKPRVSLDKYGNVAGHEYDLVRDDTFDDEIIYVINLCSQFCTLDRPREALAKKGFRVIEDRSLPAIQRMNNLLSEASQVWLISGSSVSLTEAHVAGIRNFFENGHGLYVWGDNDPWFADANYIISSLFHINMHGNSPGDQVVSLCGGGKKSGILRDHLISTGVVNIYEGITVAEVETTENVKPLIFGSNEKVITAYFDSNGRRALVDGGFTRLYEKWDSAGTDRYVVNAAAWLVNAERHGNSIKLKELKS